MSAISAAAMRCKTMADGSLRIEVEVEPNDAQAAFALFGRPGAPMAIAALVVGHAAKSNEPEPGKPKGGERAKWCAIRCGETHFQIWMRRTFPDAWQRNVTTGMLLTDAAASVLRAVCSIESRIELDNDPDVARRFDRLIRHPYGEVRREAEADHAH